MRQNSPKHHLKPGCVALLLTLCVFSFGIQKANAQVHHIGVSRSAYGSLQAGHGHVYGNAGLGGSVSWQSSHWSSGGHGRTPFSDRWGHTSIGSTWDRGPVNHSWRAPLRRNVHSIAHHSHTGFGFQGLSPASANFAASHYAAGHGMLPSALYWNRVPVFQPTVVVPAPVFTAPVFPNVVGQGFVVQPPLYLRNSDQALFNVPTAGYTEWFYDSAYGCVGPLPSYGFASPLWPGLGIVPSLLGWQYGFDQSINHPLVLSSGSYAVIPSGSGIVGQGNIFPDRFATAVPSVPGMPANMRVDEGFVGFTNPASPSVDLQLEAIQNLDQFPEALVADRAAVMESPQQPELMERLPDFGGSGTLADAPVINEFPANPRMQKSVTISDRIQSLRYQATGDASFRQGDYASAEVYYRTAMQTAPKRKAPYLRMAIVLMVRQQFGKAASHLKTGLLIQDDPTRTWITAEELYWNDGVSLAQQHAKPLWRWIESKPLSGDRLLLGGVFQGLRGERETAEGFLQLALQHGTETAFVAAAQRLSADDSTFRTTSLSGGSANRNDLPPNFKLTEFSSDAVPSPNEDGQDADSMQPGQPVRPKTDGIYMRGKDAATGASSGVLSSSPEADKSQTPLLRIPVGESPLP